MTIYLLVLTAAILVAGYIARSASTDAADARSEVAKRYASQSREFTVQVCELENQRWQKLRHNLDKAIGTKPRPGESVALFKARRKGTLALVDGIYNVPCTLEQP